MKKKETLLKKWWFWLILIIIVLFLIIEIYMYLLHINVIHRSIKCDEPQNLFCFGNSSTEIAKDKIPCSSDEDCGWKSVGEYCAPGTGSFTMCIGEKDYCGEDGFCKQCMCNY